MISEVRRLEQTTEVNVPNVEASVGNQMNLEEEQAHQQQRRETHQRDFFTNSDKQTMNWNNRTVNFQRLNNDGMTCFHKETNTVSNWRSQNLLLTAPAQALQL